MSRVPVSTDQAALRTRSQTDRLKTSVDWLGASPPVSSSNRLAILGELVGQGFDPQVAQHVVDSTPCDETAAAELRSRVRSVLAQMLLVEKPPEFFAQERTISMFAGGAGSGKTTTIAKIAWFAKTQYKKRVTMIALDPMATGGRSPLGRLGDALSIAAYTCADLTALCGLIGMLDDDLILIDTPGVGPEDHARLSAIKAGAAAANAKLHVAVSAATRPAEIEGALKRFAGVVPQRILITKSDEAESKAAFVSDLLKNLTPLSFVTDGPRVPEHLRTPSADELANYVLPHLLASGPPAASVRYTASQASLQAAGSPTLESCETSVYERLM